MAEKNKERLQLQIHEKSSAPAKMTKKLTNKINLEKLKKSNKIYRILEILKFEKIFCNCKNPQR